ncbi:MAG: TonB-dependent receptor [Ignavibacteria bacterium]|nr:TonB-dependent receptor [Ignavibacteria bacterium]
MKYIVFLFISIFVTNISLTQEDTVLISGIITSSDQVSLPNVEINFYNLTQGKTYKANTNSNGYYQIFLSGGEYKVKVSLEGYLDYEKELSVGKSNFYTLNIVLEEVRYSTEVITVEDLKKQSQSDLRTSLFFVNPQNVKILPGSVEDVLRSLRSLPGVTSPNDFTSQLVIRGSGPDQNLIIMDDVEIFNPYRLYGLVSMFNPETVIDISLITGGFPAKYGDRLSAVLDVTNKEGDRDKTLSIKTNVNIASANLILQGKNPLNIPGSWIISSRRTYYDLILGPFAKKAGLITDDSAFPSFEDVQFKIAIGPFSKHKFIFNGIFSRDGVDIISGEKRKEPDSVKVDDVTYNNVLSIGWHYIPDAHFISKTTISFYKNSGDNEFEGDILDPLLDREQFSPEQRDSLKAIGALLGFNFDSKYSFNKYSITNRSTYINKNFTLEFGAGVDIIKNDLKYTLLLDEQFKAYIRQFPNASALLEDFNIEGKENFRFNGYFVFKSNLWDKFYYQPSIRFDYYSYLKKFYLSPRINFGYAFDPLTTLRVAIGVFYQSPGYEKLIDGQSFYDLTGNVGESLRAEKSYHLILGIDRWITNQWHLKVEGYLKKFDDLISQKRETAYKYIYTINDPTNKDPNYIKNPNNWTRSSTKVPYDSLTTIPINQGKGTSFGFEVMLERKYIGSDTKLYGWINYSYSKSTRIRNGIEKPFRFDQTHSINIVLNYRALNWLEIGARWTYATNFPFTPPIGIYPRIINDSLVVNPFTNQIIFNLDYGDDNNRLSERKPAYHRLDIRFTAYTRFWNVDWSFYLDIMNVYNRKNVLNYDYNLRNDLTIERKIVGMIPILPTLGISARF